MNHSTNPSDINRRSFIKRSVVAAVAVSSITIFSGLVNATSTSPSNAAKTCKSLGISKKKGGQLPNGGYKYTCYDGNKSLGTCNASGDPV